MTDSASGQDSADNTTRTEPSTATADGSESRVASTAAEPRLSSESPASDANISRRPHALDEDADEWDAPPSKPWFTLRNLVAVGLTLTTSLLLGLVVGLPYSAGAMAGVAFGAALLFGPLWYAFAHQPYEQRFERWKSQRGEPTSRVELGEAQSLFVNPASGSQESGAARNEVAESPRSATDRVLPTGEYYRPLSEENDERLEVASFPLIVLLGVFFAIIIIGAPFLAAALLLLVR